MELTHFSLFTGIGGIDLAAEWAGFTTVGQCEFADYPTKVLKKHWPDVPKWRDIRSVTAENFYERTGLRTVDLISGGFPCQPFSVAGQRKGKDDDRYLWPEMLRVISQLKPTWVLGENVAGIINMALDTALSDLETLNYTTQAFIIPACAVGAFHRRDRVFIVANLDSGRQIHREFQNNTGEAREPAQFKNSTSDKLEYVAHTYGERMEGSTQKQVLRQRNLSSGQISKPFQRAERRFDTHQSRLCRSLHGIPNGVDRIKCLGNAVVPQQVYPILQAIADIENELRV
jgi:DNA (cytosine-5)-methyltransferase 1